jgi:hypothetical protein
MERSAAGLANVAMCLHTLGARRLIGLAATAVLFTGCQLYWLKPGADMSAFTNDHHACVRTAGTPVGTDDKLFVNLDVYRACLRARGWQRETGSKFANPPGYYRGLEDEGPVRPGDVPLQIPSELR